MPRVVIDTQEMLPPFPFLVWNKEAVQRMLRESRFDLNEPYKKTRLDEHVTLYVQGENDAKAES